MNANADTSDKWIGATVTIAVHALLVIILLFIVVKVEIPDQPMGDGNSLEVSFGSDNEGSGNTESLPAAAQVAASQPESNPDEEIISNAASDEEVVRKKQEDKQKTNKVKVQTNKTNKTTENKQQQVDNRLGDLGKLIGGEGGDGDDNKSGNEGGDGDTPGRDKGKGKGGPGGIGNNPVLISTHTQRHATYDCQEEGKYYVKVKINRQGKVVQVMGNQAKTTNEAGCLKDKALKLAKEEMYNADPKGPEFREYITNFDFYLQ